MQRCTLVNDILRMDEKSLVQKLKVIKKSEGMLYKSNESMQFLNGILMKNKLSSDGVCPKSLVKNVERIFGSKHL